MRFDRLEIKRFAHVAIFALLLKSSRGAVILVAVHVSINKFGSHVTITGNKAEPTLTT